MPDLPLDALLTLLSDATLPAKLEAEQKSLVSELERAKGEMRAASDRAGALAARLEKLDRLRRSLTHANGEAKTDPAPGTELRACDFCREKTPAAFWRYDRCPNCGEMHPLDAAAIATRDREPSPKAGGTTRRKAPLQRLEPEAPPRIDAQWATEPPPIPEALRAVRADIEAAPFLQPKPDLASLQRPGEPPPRDLGPLFAGLEAAKQERMAEARPCLDAEDIGILASVKPHELDALRQHEINTIGDLIDFVEDTEATGLSGALRNLKGPALTDPCALADALERFCDGCELPRPKPRSLDVEIARLMLEGVICWLPNPLPDALRDDEHSRVAFEQLRSYPAWWGRADDLTGDLERNQVELLLSGCPEAPYDVRVRAMIEDFRVAMADGNLRARPEFGRWEEFALPGTHGRATCLYRPECFGGDAFRYRITGAPDRDAPPDLIAATKANAGESLPDYAARLLGLMQAADAPAKKKRKAKGVAE